MPDGGGLRKRNVRHDEYGDQHGRPTPYYLHHAGRAGQDQGGGVRWKNRNGRRYRWQTILKNNLPRREASNRKVKACIESAGAGCEETGGKRTASIAFGYPNALWGEPQAPIKSTLYHRKICWNKMKDNIDY